jgi:uncharacterized protein YlxW (UPF0749 family)
MSRVTTPPEAGRTPRPDASMSLLVDIASQALDPAYADVAARRSTSGELRRPQHSRGLLVLAGVLAATLLIAAAAVQAHRRAPLLERSRQGLLDQVRRETDLTASLQRRLDALRDSTQALRARALASTASGSAVAAQLAQEELAAGTVAATGPGLRVVVDDAPSTSGGSGNQVLDRDLQALVNALWAAGAEAVAVDDQRLTAQSAIRQAGSSILVNFEPVSRPYVITAIGDPVALATSFAASSAAAQMRTYSQVYGLRFDYSRENHLTVPSAPGLPLRYARAASTGSEERQ